MQNSLKMIPVVDERFFSEDWADMLQQNIDQPVKMVFIDIDMKFMDAVEAYRDIRVINPDAVVVMMVANAVEELLQNELENENYWIFREPLDLDRMINILEDAEISNGGALILAIGEEKWFKDTLYRIIHEKSYELDTVFDSDEIIPVNIRSTYGTSSWV